MTPLEQVITSLQLNLIVQYIEDTAYIPLGFLYESDQETITDIEAQARVTVKSPTTFDAHYGYYHTAHEQGIITDRIENASLEEVRKFLNKHVY